MEFQACENTFLVRQTLRWMFCTIFILTLVFRIIVCDKCAQPWCYRLERFTPGLLFSDVLKDLFFYPHIKNAPNMDQIWQGNGVKKEFLAIFLSKTERIGFC